MCGQQQLVLENCQSPTQKKELCIILKYFISISQSGKNYEGCTQNDIPIGNKNNIINYDNWHTNLVAGVPQGFTKQ